MKITFDMTAGPGDRERRDLEERVTILKDKIRKDAQEIVEVLKAHFPLWIERQVKDYFVSNPTFSETLDKDQIRAVKEDIRAQQKKVLEELIPELEDWASGAPRTRSRSPARRTTWRTTQRCGSGCRRWGSTCGGSSRDTGFRTWTPAPSRRRTSRPPTSSPRG